MNRKQRRMAKVREQRVRVRDIDSRCDIQVEGKFEQIVMIVANPKGRRIVEDLWPDVQWTSDKVFSRAHSAEWLFTHVRVTRLPPHFTTPLTFATPRFTWVCSGMRIVSSRLACEGCALHRAG